MAISYNSSFTLGTGNKAYVGAEAVVTNGTTSSSIAVTAGAYLTDGWVQSTGIVAKIYINNNSTPVATKTILGNGTKYTATAKKTVSSSKSITKTHDDQTVSWKVEFWQYTDGYEQGLKKTISGTSKVTPKTSYAISYNANGGSGAPSGQTKWHGETLTLSKTVPTRSGYTFQGWATSSGGGVSYKAGASYTTNAKATLYAVWKANTYTIKYNVNGGSGTVANQTKTHGVTLVLSKTVPNRTNYTFLGWSTSSTATTATYTAGGNFTTNANTTLYAVWKLAYVKPTIKNLSVNRCDSDKTISDMGAYALVSFDWSSFIEAPIITIQWKLATASSYPSENTVTITGSDTSRTISQRIGADDISPDSTYIVYVKIADTNGYSETTKSLSGQKFTIDRLAGGNGIAFGKPAELSGYADFAFKTRCRDRVVFNNNTNIYGIDTDGTERIALMPVTDSGNTSLGYGNYSAKKGSTHIYGNEVNFYTDKGIYTNGNKIVMNNEAALYAKGTDGKEKSLMCQSDSNNTVIGYGNYKDASGNTHIYGHDVVHYVGNIATPDGYRPYRRRGDTVNMRWPGSGFVTNGGTQVHFFIPFAEPIVGAPTISLTSSDGFILRQNGKYTHGSGADVRVKPNSYTTTLYALNGIRVYATFSDLTNVTNNSSIGIDWIGTIIFS